MAQALVASSAIPLVFLWYHMTIRGKDITLVDGAVITNQPLSKLALDEKCGTILACAVGYFGGAINPPTNAINNAYGCSLLMTHQCSKMEEDYVRTKLGTQGVVHHIHPIIETPMSDTSFDFTPDLVHKIVDESCEKTMTWLNQNRDQVGKLSGNKPWLSKPWMDDSEPA
ncbi:MAG: hypothetical protein NVS2B16_19100 [Chloroflexota bacterium]